MAHGRRKKKRPTKEMGGALQAVEYKIKSGEARGIGGSWEDLPSGLLSLSGLGPAGLLGMTMTMHSHKLTVV